MVRMPNIARRWRKPSICSAAQRKAVAVCTANCKRCKRTQFDKRVGNCEAGGKSAAAYVASKCGDADSKSWSTSAVQEYHAVCSSATIAQCVPICNVTHHGFELLATIGGTDTQFSYLYYTCQV